jgi:hypothetical protein
VAEALEATRNKKQETRNKRQESRDKNQDASVAERCTEFIEVALEATRDKILETKET